eukprot:783428-Amphidinium_carterae.1
MFTWEVKSTLRKQNCKPKAQKKGKTGKAPLQQKGGALPLPPGPGSLTRGRGKGPRKTPQTPQTCHRMTRLPISQLKWN